MSSSSALASSCRHEAAVALPWPWLRSSSHSVPNIRRFSAFPRKQLLEWPREMNPPGAVAYSNTAPRSFSAPNIPHPSPAPFSFQTLLSPGMTCHSLSGSVLPALLSFREHVVGDIGLRVHHWAQGASLWGLDSPSMVEDIADRGSGLQTPSRELAVCSEPELRDAGQEPHSGLRAGPTLFSLLPHQTGSNVKL